MNTSNDIRRGRHCTFNIHVHLVFVTKYRRGVITDRVFEKLSESWNRTAQKLGLNIVEANFEENYVHMHIEYPPSLSISKMVNALKGASSYSLRKADYPEVKKLLWGKHLWSPSYFVASCGGASLDILKQYINNQKGFLPVLKDGVSARSI